MAHASVSGHPSAVRRTDLRGAAIHKKVDHDEAGIVGVVRLDDVNDSATGAVDKRSLSPEVVSQYDFGADHDDTRATCLS